MFFKDYCLDAVPGGCGAGSSDAFAASSISTNWVDGQHIDSSLNSSEILNSWTSTINFYAVADPKGTMDMCSKELNPDSTFINNVVYHVYYIPLVASGGGGSSNTFEDPTTSDVLKVLSRISSAGDALLRGNLVASVNAK